jgi:hypothetical protein
MQEKVAQPALKSSPLVAQKIRCSIDGRNSHNNSDEAQSDFHLISMYYQIVIRLHPITKLRDNPRYLIANFRLLGRLELAQWCELDLL